MVPVFYFLTVQCAIPGISQFKMLTKVIDLHGILGSSCGVLVKMTIRSEGQVIYTVKNMDISSGNEAFLKTFLLFDVLCCSPVGTF